jgi:hypothetical protein
MGLFLESENIIHAALTLKELILFLLCLTMAAYEV